MKQFQENRKKFQRKLNSNKVEETDKKIEKFWKNTKEFRGKRKNGFMFHRFIAHRTRVSLLYHQPVEVLELNG